MPRTAKRERRPKDQITGKLRAADPFELIRWLARSQPDPRKALAELVQNSIDAGAKNVHVTRLRAHGVTALHVLDDGEGVIPEMERCDALNYIATHIGHSRKRDLTPQQRRELMLQGKYGIGLLGFWAIGGMMEMRSQIPGQPSHLLRMFEDSPRFEIEGLRSRLALGERYTEIVVRKLHRPAFLSLSARRITDYLAAELRGQLLARDVRILVHDRIARGRAPKVLEVQPVRFSGQRLKLAEEVPVDGFAPMRVELYLLPAVNGGEGQVSVSCNGTAVYEHAWQIEVADLHRSPWTERRLNGLIEFSDFQVPPGSRRGVVPDQAALAFCTALRSLEPGILAQLLDAEARAAAAVEADVLRQLEKAFRDLRRLAPQYDFFAVRAPGTAPFGEAPERGRAQAASDSEGGEPTSGIPVVEAVTREESTEEEAPSLLPAGLLASVQIIPASTQVERLGLRRFRAEARDSSGILIRRPLSIRWWTDSPLGQLLTEGLTSNTFQAGPDFGTATIFVEVREENRSAAAEATIKIVEAAAGDEGSHAGIPEPVFVDEPLSSWRSRMSDSYWQVNSAHPDFRTASETPRRKLRYLASLLAKEVVLHSFPAPQLEPVLERLVEVLTIAERRLERG
jgi:hypothetical protein